MVHLGAVEPTTWFCPTLSVARTKHNGDLRAYIEECMENQCDFEYWPFFAKQALKTYRQEGMEPAIILRTLAMETGHSEEAS